VWGAPSYPSAAPVPPEAAEGAEVEALKGQVSYLEQYLESLRRRIQKLEGEAKAE
jgi:prefoldin subunit 5